MRAIERHVRNLSSVMRKFIVVTGASKGIGRAAADALADDGWSVIGVGRRSPDHFPGVFIEADLADRDKIQALADDLTTRGNVLGIVNNVGLARHETICAVDPDVFATVMEFNVRPAQQLTMALLPAMRAARFGRIINITSLVTRGFAFRASYAAAKSGPRKPHENDGDRVGRRGHYCECRCS